MGIPHLSKWVQWVSKPQTICWNQWYGKHVGVDALSFMYREKDQTARIRQVYTLVQQWRSVGVEPIFVFDGRVPQEKCCKRPRFPTTTQSAPVVVNTMDRDGVKQLLYTMGVLAVNAAAEADQVLAYAARNGWIDAVVSTDLDYLPRGVGTLVIPTGSNIHEWREISLPRLLVDADMSYQSFVHLCVLLGSDYCPSIPTLSYQSIYWALKGGSTWEEIVRREGVRTTILWERAIRIFMGEEDRWEDMLAPKQREKWSRGPPPAEPTALAEILANYSSSTSSSSSSFLS